MIDDPVVEIPDLELPVTENDYSGGVVSYELIDYTDQLLQLHNDLGNIYKYIHLSYFLLITLVVLSLFRKD